MKPLNEDWRGWLRLNRDRGCDRLALFREAAAQGFDPAAIQLELGGNIGLEEALATTQNLSAADTWAAWASPPLVLSTHRPRAWKLDTALAQIYEIPDLLTPEECAAATAAIDRALVPSAVTFGPADYRTSRTCYLGEVDAELCARLDARFSSLLGVDATLAEPLQGQRYDPGEYFKAHTDWFAPETEEYSACTQPGGQRTWTLMVYLNRVDAGGETCFNLLERRFVPIPGLALCWNNLNPDGSPNALTLHEALAVEAGRKYVITKWFRAEPGRMP